MTDPVNFLSRWSRKKRQEKIEERRQKESPEQCTEGGVTVAQPMPSPGAKPATAWTPGETTVEPTALAKPAPGSDAFDPASLPAIDSIGAQSDLGAFLRPGVPTDLKNAALRRAWSIDPAIRDFKGLQENDWNFNDPNGIPGFGALNCDVDVTKMVATLFGDAGKPQRHDTQNETDQPDFTMSNKSAVTSDGRRYNETDAQPGYCSSTENSNEQGDPAKLEKIIAVQNIEVASEPLLVRAVRRRGGALPHEP